LITDRPLRRIVGSAAGALFLFFLLLLLVPSPSFADSEDTLRGFEVLLHYRLPDGKEEIVRGTDFEFVYYERRIAQKPTGLGKPAKIEIRDLPHELRSLQDEDYKKLKFKKLSKIRFEYREEEGKGHLYLVVTPLSKKKKKQKPDIAWPAHRLRNTSVARAPHFRAKVDAQDVEVALPPLLEEQARDQRILTAIDFKFPGQKKRRDWF
jgi:hypothetical protein